MEIKLKYHIVLLIRCMYINAGLHYKQPYAKWLKFHQYNVIYVQNIHI